MRDRIELRHFWLRSRSLSFLPEFAAEYVPVPVSHPEVTFLIAQSFVTADKATSAARHYNLRVVEVTFAAVVLAKPAPQDDDDYMSLPPPAQVPDAIEKQVAAVVMVEMRLVDAAHI